MPYAVGPRGARIHYRCVGERGPTVVLLQGLGLSSRFWFDEPEKLAGHPSDPYRVIVLDNRGTGRSDAPRGPYRMRHMADDVAAVLDAAGAPSAIVVGISMGGMIAQHVALRHPDRVRGLVLLATTCGLPHGRFPRARTLATLLALPVVRPRKSRALARLLLSEAHLPRARELFEGWPAALAESPIAKRAFFGQLAAVAGHSTGFRLRRIACPTVIVTGDDDALVPARNSEVIARRIPNSALEILRDVGHGIPMVEPEVVRRALDRVRAMPSPSAAR